MRKLLILMIAALFMSHLTVAQSFNAASYPHGNMPSGFSDSPAMGAYTNWKNSYVEYCAANGDHRVRFDNPGQSVSEGIAYGMLLAAYANDKDIFDGLTRYYNRFKNADGVMDWKTGGCSGVLGTGGAADAEFDYALALIVADKRWGSNGALDYAAYARDMIGIIKDKEISSSLVPRPGPYWGGDNITNPSYYTPAYFRVFGQYTGDEAYWNSVASKCYQVLAAIKSTLNPAYGLVPDWCTSSGGFSGRAAEIGYFQSGTKYHYDAARTPWRITTDYLWFGISEAGEYANQCYQFADTKGGCQGIVDGYNMDGSSYGTANSSTFSGSFAVSYMYAPAGQASLNSAYNYFVNKVPSGYFNTTLHALYMFTLTGNFWNPLTFNGGGNDNGSGNSNGNSCSTVTIPSQIEAEAYCAMSGIQTEDCSEGGQNIGYVDDEDWMSYQITVPTTGTYEVSYRVASLNGGNQLQLDTDAGNVVLGIMNIPATGGWQNWQTVSHTVTLNAGTYEIGIKANIGGYNLNWFEISNGTTDSGNGNDNSNDNSGNTACSGSSPVSLPFAYTGLQEQCIEVSEDIDVINSWGAAEVTVNGVDITNIWVNSLPAKQNGKYYINFKGQESWATIEISKAGNARFQTAGLDVNAEEVLVYPNPLSGAVLNVSVPENMLGAQLSVFDINGKQVYSQQVAYKKITIAKSHFSYAGIYFVELQGIQGKETIKLVVK